MTTVFCIIGTRPEAIKVAPLILELRLGGFINVVPILTGQHTDLVAGLLEHFGIYHYKQLSLRTGSETLNEFSSKLILGLDALITEMRPDLIVVQGDTTSAMMSAISGFYRGIPVAHLEAGLRTDNIYSPFPEEGNRRIISQISELHFAPTETCKNNLIKSGVREPTIHVVGNTVIDALLYEKKSQEQSTETEEFFVFRELKERKCDKIILITSHRRENLGERLNNICQATLSLSYQYPNILFTFPVHPNPVVQRTVYEALSNIRNILLIDPLPYSNFVRLMSHSTIILTDSGGVQEEAPSLDIPVVVMREETERTEGVEAGCLVLAGTEADRIENITNKLLTDQSYYHRISKSINPYGDGTAAYKIMKIINARLSNE